MPVVNVHVRGASTNQVATALEKITRRRAIVSTPAADWVTVWDEMSERNILENERVARELSAVLSAPVVGLSVSKDEVIYFIYEAGARLDLYVSCPDSGDEVRDAKRAADNGHPEVLVRFARPGTDLQVIADVLSGAFEESDMEFERERGARLTDLLGIPRRRVDPRWERRESDDTENFVTVENPVGLLSQSLFEAIKACNVPAAVSLLDNGAPLESTDEWGSTLLQRAVETEHGSYEFVSPERLQIVRLLIARGISRGAIQGALVWAVARQALPLVVELVEAGADVNHVDELGRTALTTALGHPHPSLDLVRWLLRAGANPSARVDMREPGGMRRAMTPLRLAAVRNVDLLRLLLDAGADPHVRDGAGYTPLIAAAFSGKTEAVALLLSAGSIEDAHMPDGRSILPSLESHRDLAGVIALLQEARAKLE